MAAGKFKNAQALGPLKYHPLRTNINGTQMHSDRCLVLGDAAGLVSPYTGEGIASGLFRGALAAEVLGKAFATGSFEGARLAGYTNTLKKRYEGDHRAAYRLRSILRKPGLLNHFFRAMQKSPELAQLFALCYLDEKSPQLLLRPRNLLRFLKY